MKTTFATILLFAAQAAAESERIDPSGTLLGKSKHSISPFDATSNLFVIVDIANSSKLVGRIDAQKFFDPWVNAQVPTPVNPDEHPCLFEFLCEEYGWGDVSRLALHLSQNCPPELVEDIIFQISYPADSHLYHSDPSNILGACDVLTFDSETE